MMTTTTTSQMLQLAPLAPHASSSSSSSLSQTFPVWFNHCHCHPSRPQLTLRRRRPRPTVLLAANPDRKLQVSSSSSSSWTTQQDQDDQEEDEDEDDDEEEESDPTPEDLEYISQIKRVLELLKKNRDMIFNEVKLTIAIEDIREVERKRLLGIEDPDAPTREELAAVLEEVHEGKIPKNRLALKLLAEEMNRWPNLEVQIKPAKKKPGKSLYARVTDTGIDLKEAAKRLNIDWDTAAEIDDADVKDESDVPSVVGYGALYLVTLFPVIIGVSVSNAKPSSSGFLLFHTMANPVSDEMLHISRYGFRNTTMEKQISVDPISLHREESANPVQAGVTAPEPKGQNQLPALLPPTNSKFLSISLPNSATSSPRFGASLLKKKWKNERQVSPQKVEDVNQLHSASFNPLHLQQELQFRRTKSCGEGREYAPDDFDLWLIQPNANEIVNRAYTSYTSFSKTEVNRPVHENGKKKEPTDDIDEFKCGALCLFLPGFGGKAKPVRARKVESELQNRNVISRSVSLEKFECGSWASQNMVSGNLEDSMGHFDLPLELIRGNVNDAHSPVTTGFLFDKDIKGVLKNGSARTSAARRSHESPRHVRFSTSSPKSYPASPGSCITPRLRKAREDFNSFLEAQSA